MTAGSTTYDPKLRPVRTWLLVVAAMIALWCWSAARRG